MPDGTEEIYFYGISGQKLGTYKPFVYSNASFTVTAIDTNLYFGSRTIVSRGVTVIPDRLGSNRAGGSRYFPYGEEQPIATAQDRDKFATYYRDGTTGLDYAQNRYYASTLGRFLSPDPYQASAGAENPGSWNRYTYVVGDPINQVDPTGLVSDGFFDDTIGSGWGCVAIQFALDYQIGSGDCPIGTVAVYNRAGSAIPTRQQEIWNSIDAIRPYISDWGYANNAGTAFNLSFDSQTYPTVLGICVAQPELCLIVAGAATVYVTATYLPNLITAIQLATQTRKLITVRADCSVHQIGTPNHASAGTISATGQGTNIPAAQASAYVAAQAAVRAEFGVGFHAQHCRYTELK
jgi:RHS repeat-associated protein